MRKRSMTKLQINPKYGQSPAMCLPEPAELPRLEKSAAAFGQDDGIFNLGLWPAYSQPKPRAMTAAKQLLGADFSHVIVTR
jgi:hypothetical protein